MLINATGGTAVQAASLLLSSLEQKRRNYPRWGFSLVGSILLFVFIVGTIEAIMTLYIFAKNKTLRNPTNTFIIGLAICDLCMAVFALPFAIAAAFAGGWNSGKSGCLFEAFIVYFFGLTSLYILTAVSVDRYIVITKPLHSRFISKRVATLSLVVCFGGGMFWALLPVFGWNGYGQELSGVTCGLQYRDHSTSATSFIITIFVFCFVLPSVVMVFCYYSVFMTIRTMNKTGTAITSDRLARRNIRVERKLLKTCIAIVVSFWVCWVPYAIVSFWQAFGDLDSLPLTVTLVPAVAAKSQLVLNPAIYVATNSRFRLALYKAVPCVPVRVYLLRRESGQSEEEHGEDTNIENLHSQKKSYSCSVVPVGSLPPATVPSTSTNS